MQKRFLPQERAKQTEQADPIPRGHAAVFNTWTVLYSEEDFQVREMLLPTSWDRVLQEKIDIVALRNHNKDQPLGRTSDNTLRLWTDKVGVAFESDFPDVSYARDLKVLLERRDIKGMSFGFFYCEGGYTRTDYTRDGIQYIDFAVSDLDPFEISFVTFPQYTEADVAMRDKFSNLRPTKPVRTPKRNAAERALRLANLKL